MKTAVLIHGCHLQAKDWENIIWGDPQNGVWGRASKGLQVAIREKPELIYWGTSASEKNGIKEAQYTFDYALSHVKDLEYFKRRDVQDIEQSLHRVSFIDMETQNTPQETRRAMEMCRDRGIERLVLVSSPTHVARCLQSAERVRAEGGFEGLEILATASDTCFADSTPADVLIVEPPHRGDRPEVPIHETLKLTMRFRKESFEVASAFNEDLAKFIQGWKYKTK